MKNDIVIRPKTGQLVRGKSEAVQVVIEFLEPLKVRGLHADFRGAEETKANYTVYNASTKTHQTHTAVQTEDVTRQQHVLSGRERMGFFGNLGDALATVFGAGKHDVLQPGQYSFDLELDVPADAPATHKGKKSRIYYELSVRVDIPLGRDIKSMVSFELPPLPKPPPQSTPVHTRYPDDEGRGLWDSLFGPDLTIEAGMLQNVYQPGDVIQGVFRVDTQKSLECRNIYARLVAGEVSHAHGHADGHWHNGPRTHIASPILIDRVYKQDFQLPVEPNFSLTCSGKNFTIDWFLQIELDVPWAKDPKIRVPVMLIQ